MKISERGQITIPKALRKQYGLYSDVDVEFVLEKDGLKLRKLSLKQHPVEEIYGILNMPSLTDEYLEKIRGR